MQTHSENRPERLPTRSAAERTSRPRTESAPNPTSLPDTLKTGVENLSGLSLDHVRVHRNSAKPAQLNAHAYAQGSDIHLAPNQEKHLPHEAWHVVQQAQGRVQPTTKSLTGVPINDDARLEAEADTMGRKAIDHGTSSPSPLAPTAGGGGNPPGPSSSAPIQGYFVLFNLGPGQITTVDATVRKALGKDAALQQLATEWALDATPHYFSDWEAVKQHLLTLGSIKTNAEKACEFQEGTAEIIADLFHRKLKPYDPVWVELVHRGALLIKKRCALWNWDSAWIDRTIELLHAFNLLTAAPRFLPDLLPGIPPPYDPHSVRLIPPAAATGSTAHLSGISARLSAGDFKERHRAIGDIRGTDDDEHMQTHRFVSRGPGQQPEAIPIDPYIKGAILLKFIKDNRAAVLNLVRQLGDDTVALFSLERGGSLLADHIAAYFPGLPNVKIPKPQGGGDEYRRRQHQQHLVLSMMDTEEGQMFRLLCRRPELLRVRVLPSITIALAETAVSGSSVNTLLDTLNRCHSLLPFSRFRLLVEKQTIKEAKLKTEVLGGTHVTDPGINLAENLDTTSLSKVQMFIAHAQYILGEDVGYQVSCEGMQAGKPVVIFDESSGQLIAVQLA
ncbi:MAG TPA: DUF4157 domain-containing protein, partial [Candidatus Didemnitutus sp.]|nr:DUF4157 domain-containing protein [Candidatus Didemnitutus sp.]